MGRRPKFNLSLLVLAVLFALAALRAAWMTLQDADYMQVGDYAGGEEWRVWRFRNGLEVRMHHPKSTPFLDGQSK